MGRRRKSPSCEPEGRKNFAKKTGELTCSDDLRSNTANERERARMRVLSKAFVRLKTSLPWVPSDTKLSKLDTLRLASRYIAHLRKVLDAGDGTTDAGERLVSADQDAGHQRDLRPISEYDRMLNSEDIHPINLSWPFTANLRKSALQSQNGFRTTTTTTTTTTSSSLAPSSLTTTTATSTSSASSNVSSTGEGGLSFP